MQAPKQKPTFDDLADASLTKWTLYILWPILLALGMYWYCESFEPSCQDRKEAEREEKSNAKKPDDFAVLYKTYGKSAEQMAVEGITPLKCSIPCHIINKALDDPVGLFTGVLAYIVYIQVLLMFRQETWLRRSFKAAATSAGAAIRSVKATQDTAEKDLRAYVFVESGSIQNLANGQHPTSRIVVHNFGKTPAYKLTIICGIGFGRSFEELPTAVPPPSKPMGTLAPGGTVEHHNSTPIAFTPDHMLALENGTGTLYVHGEIRYVDFLGNNRTTKFRTMKSAMAGLSGPQLASCEDGNDAD